MKLVKSCAAVLLLVSSLGAWASDGPLPAEERAKAWTDKMTTLLALSKEQVPQVATINLEWARKIEEIRMRPEASVDERAADKRDAQSEREGKLKGVFDARQWSLYREKKDALSEEMKAWAHEQHSKAN